MLSFSLPKIDEINLEELRNGNDDKATSDLYGQINWQRVKRYGDQYVHDPDTLMYMGKKAQKGAEFAVRQTKKVDIPKAAENAAISGFSTLFTTSLNVPLAAAAAGAGFATSCVSDMVRNKGCKKN